MFANPSSRLSKGADTVRFIDEEIRLEFGGLEDECYKYSKVEI